MLSSEATRVASAAGIFFEHEGETSLSPGAYVRRPEVFGFGLFFCAHGVCSEFVDGLRCKSEMSHHGYAGAQDAFYRFADFRTALHLHRFSVAFFS